MRILVISNLYPYRTKPLHGIFTARQWEMAARLGADVTLFFAHVWIPRILQRISSKYRDYDQNHTPVEYPGVKVFSVPCVRWTRGIGGCRWDGLSIYRATRRKAVQLHRQKPFDVIYGKGIFPSADAGARLSELLTIPVVGEGIGGDVHVAPDYSPAMYRHFVRTVRALHGAVADGKGVADRLSSVMQMEVPTIHGLVDLDVFKPLADRQALRRRLGMPPDALVLLFVGSLNRAKGVYELIEAFTRVGRQASGAILRICGQGIEHDRLDSLTRAHELAETVQLVGPVHPERMHEWMQASDVFVLPSYTEGMPNVVMEAMACGLPVVSTTVGGLPDAVGDSEGAILVDPRAVDPLTEALRSVCTDRLLRERMALAARRTAEQRFGLEQNVGKTLAYVQSVVRKAQGI
ncbi:MAG: glycosyltransferase [Phycisphaerae bacterium]|nr:glycosyltransferase [Phycisphaerae bacterium]